MKEMLAKRAAQLGQAAPSAYGVVEKKEEDEEEERFQDPDNEVGLFSSGMNYDKEDDEADRIYQDVDERMDKRRRIRRLVSLIFPFPALPQYSPPLPVIVEMFISVFPIEQIPTMSYRIGKPARRKNAKSTRRTTRRSNYSLPT
jgi:hypothetical protein